MTDLLAQPYRPEGIGDNRFIVAQTIIVRTEQVDRVARLNQQTGELVKRGVVLADTGGPTYLFTRLNEIKPEMLAEATRNARLSAEQFAADSGSAIAEIRRASQGLFEILPRDPAPGLMEAEPGGQEGAGGQHGRVPARPTELLAAWRVRACCRLRLARTASRTSAQASARVSPMSRSM